MLQTSPEFVMNKTGSLIQNKRKQYINHKVGEEDVVKTLQRVGLNPQDKRIYQKYSLGMKQRLIIAQAIMEKPDIIFWDEPTNSLDENGVNGIR
mgnify:CR=1 FL=1